MVKTDPPYASSSLPPFPPPLPPHPFHQRTFNHLDIRNARFNNSLAGGHTGKFLSPPVTVRRGRARLGASIGEGEASPASALAAVAASAAASTGAGLPSTAEDEDWAWLVCRTRMD